MKSEELYNKWHIRQGDHMKNNIHIFIILLALFMGFAGAAEGAVVIKVRAINPLDEEAPVVIHYPLPGGITAEDVLGKRLVRSSSGSGKPTDFQINFDEEENTYFVDHQMTLAPKEIVVLEIEADDVWTVPLETIDDLRGQAENLLKERPRGEGEEEFGPDPVAVKLKEEIFRQLEQILQAQEKSGITQAGVQGHIDAYQRNRGILQQVSMDMAMLRNIMMSAQETPEEGEKSGPNGGSEIQPQPEMPPPTAQDVPAPAVTEPEPRKKSVADKLKSLFKR